MTISNMQKRLQEIGEKIHSEKRKKKQDSGIFAKFQYCNLYIHKYSESKRKSPSGALELVSFRQSCRTCVCVLQRIQYIPSCLCPKKKKKRERRVWNDGVWNSINSSSSSSAPDAVYGNSASEYHFLYKKPVNSQLNFSAEASSIRCRVICSLFFSPTLSIFFLYAFFFFFYSILPLI